MTPMLCEGAEGPTSIEVLPSSRSAQICYVPELMMLEDVDVR